MIPRELVVEVEIKVKRLGGKKKMKIICDFFVCEVLIQDGYGMH